MSSDSHSTPAVPSAPAQGVELIGRYELHAQIAAGGMARVHLGRLRGAAGFGRTVAIKRLHPWLVADPNFADMLVNEARLAARIRHPNVVATLDVVSEQDELFIVMDYVLGEPLSRLVRLAAKAGERVPRPIALATIVGALQGVHAAHEATAEDGTPLEIVHRDLSPQNVVVDVHGLARVLDFGIAKARGRIQETRPSQLKGKVRYMAPEQVHGATSRRSDIFSMGIVLWQLLAGRRLFDGDSDGEVLARVLEAKVPPPSGFDPNIAPELERAVLRSLERAPEDRYATALEMARALERADATAKPSEVAEWLERVAGAELTAKRSVVMEVERRAVSDATPAASRRPPEPASMMQVPVDSTKLTSSAAARSAPPSRRLGVGLLLLVAAVVLGALMVVRPWQSRTAAPASSAEPAEPVEPSVPAPVEASQPSATADPEDAAPAMEAGPLPSKKLPQARPQPKRAPAGCNPPYKIDPATGHKIFKRECL